MDKPLDEKYLVWLYSQVASVRLKNPAQTYWSLLRQLYTKEFVWIVPNDDNRVEDGRDLRREFIFDLNLDDVDPLWLNLGCSMLEMLIGLSRRCAFEVEGGESDWFWHLLDNLNLGGFNDLYFQTEKQERYVDSVMDAVIWRSYRSDGFGGLFPLKHPKDDQRQVELWYQLSSYLLEGHGV